MHCKALSLLPTIICLAAACGSNGSSSGAGGAGVVGGSGATGGSGLGGGGSSATGATSTRTGGSDSGGPSSIPPSCQSSGPGLTDCGPNGESCCTSLKVQGGTFDRTYTNDGSGATDEADPATISDFRLDKYLVTVGRFRQFVEAWNGGSGYTPPAGSGKHNHLNGGKGLADSGDPGSFETGWLTSDNDYITPTNQNLITCNDQFATWTMSPGTQEKLPMNCVNWYEAYAFCIWDGGFMPSETEFEYTSAGGSQQREYPWGTTDPGTANKYAIWNCNYGSDPGNCTDVTNIAPVGSATLGAGLWGQLDLVGNLLEWNLDYNAPYASPCIGLRLSQGWLRSGDPRRLLPEQRRVQFGFGGPQRGDLRDRSLPRLGVPMRQDAIARDHRTPQGVRTELSFGP